MVAPLPHIALNKDMPKYIRMGKGKYRNMTNRMNQKFVDEFYIPITKAEYRMYLLNK